MSLREQGAVGYKALSPPALSWCIPGTCPKICVWFPCWELPEERAASAWHKLSVRILPEQQAAARARSSAAGRCRPLDFARTGAWEQQVFGS